MKLTNGDIFVAQRPLATLVDMKFPVAISYKLAKLVSKINEQLQVIEATRNGLIRQYGAPNEGGQVVVSEGGENFQKFLDEFNTLMAIEVELVIAKVKLPEEVDGKPLEVEPSLLMALDKFVEV